MSYEPPTGTILGLLRTTIGTSTTIGVAPDTLVVTWKSKPEAPVLRYLSSQSAELPAVVLEPGETEQTPGPGANVLECRLPVTISLALKRSTLTSTAGGEQTIHRCLREIGETVVGALMDAGPALGSDDLYSFDVGAFGSDEETPELLERTDIGVYRIECEAVYLQLRPRPA